MYFWLQDNKYKGEHQYAWVSKAANAVDPVIIGKINDLKGKWTHVKLHVLWKKDDTGRFIIYKNNEVIADLKNIKTLADTCNSGYLKLGIYRHRTLGIGTPTGRVCKIKQFTMIALYLESLKKKKE